MAKKIPFGNAILCDYVGRADGGKSTLVGAFSGNVVLEEAPANLVLGFYLELGPFEQTQVITIQIRLNGTPVGVMENEIERSEHPAVVAIQQFPLRIDGPSDLEILGRAGGFSQTYFIKKKVIAPSPSASPPPSLQSPTDAPAKASRRAKRRPSPRPSDGEP